MPLTAIAFLAGSCLLGPTVWAEPKPKPVCEMEAARSATKGDKDYVRAQENVTVVSSGVNLGFVSQVANSSANFFNENSLALFQSPREACSFDHVVINTDSQCSPVAGEDHPVQVVFNCTDEGQETYNLDDEDDANAIATDTSVEDLFNGVKTLLGLGHLEFPAACGQEDMAEECAEAICDGIKDELENGNGVALSTAGDLGQLFGSLQAGNARCFFSSQYAVINSMGGGCTADDVAGEIALDALIAPEISVQLDSDGAGAYTITELLGGNNDFISIDMDSCVAAFQITQ